MKSKDIKTLCVSLSLCVCVCVCVYMFFYPSGDLNLKELDTWGHRVVLN